MSRGTDLTRWNRAGLARFRYIDGNAATYLEELRKYLAASFPDWEELEVTIPSDENASQRLDRLLHQYYGEPDDLGLEIARAFGRACHILTEHLNAYANEGYLGTATQWDNVRRLVEMLDYYPAPPASASTTIVVNAKGHRGTLERGFQIQHSPADGGAPVVFETLEDLPVDPAVNALRPAGWNRSPETFRSSGAKTTGLPREAAGSSPWLAAEGSGISVGQVGLMVREPNTAEAAVVVVDELDAVTGVITLEDQPHQLDWRNWTKGETSLLVKPKFIGTPRLSGPGVTPLAGAHDLSAGEAVAWRDAAGLWVFDRVAEAGTRALRLECGDVPPLGAEVFRAPEVERGEDALRFPFAFEAAALPTVSGWKLLTEDDSVVEAPDEEDAVSGAKYRRLRLGEVMSISLVPKGARPVGRVATQLPQAFFFDGKPEGLASGQWVVADDGNRLWPLRIARITEAEDHYSVSFGVAIEPAPAVADRSVLAIQGVGNRYRQALIGKGIATVGDLAEPETLNLGVGISPVRLREFVSKAQSVLTFRGDPEVLAPILDRTLARIVDASDETLADELSQPQARIAALKEDLHRIEACVDQTTFRGVRLRELLPRQDSSTFTVSGHSPEHVVRLYGLFEHSLRPTGYNHNPTLLIGSSIELELEKLPHLLAPGRRVVIEKEDEGVRSGAFEARVLSVHPEVPAIDVDPPVPSGAGFTVGNTVLSGNVVPAGHGETRPQKILGSGDATRSGQSFVLKEEGVSFVADPTMPTGVRADIEVNVAGQTWTQVSNLRESGPADSRYAVRMTEERHLEIQFGDGRHGRRLPSGGNNVRAKYRVGTGLAGNLSAESLDQPLRPHARVDSVRQPVPATGGNDMERVQSLRDNAPASVLSLERAVSLSDFSALAARQASVWQARAFAVPAGPQRRESVEVVIVPAGGGTLGALGTHLRGFLETHAIPGVEIRLSPADMVAFDLSVTVRIKSAGHEPKGVLGTVRAALLDAFSLRRRKLGQHLFLSEVYKVVEGVRGVENSHCVLQGDPAVRRTDASERQVLYLDPSLSVLTLKHEEFFL